MSNGALLSRVLRTGPEKFAGFNGEYWLHPIRFTDQLVMDSLVDELMGALVGKVSSEEVKKQAFSKMVVIATVHLSLRKGEEMTSELVFPSLDEAMRNFKNTPQTFFEAYGRYAATFELTDTEKKISPQAENSVTT